jgi:NADP-dependent 3-hydroxy acid dehydrogenase YdfG
MSGNIAGKVVVITGASSGLGESAARHLAKLGATVVLGARRKDRLDTIVKDIQAEGGKALAVTVDVTKRAEVEGLVQKTIDAYGKIDVLVNNAGIMPIAPLALLKVDEWERAIDINIKRRTLWYRRGSPALPEGKERSLHQHIFRGGYQGVCSRRVGL